MTPIAQKIIPNLWYDRQAEEAARHYASIFRDSRVGEPIRATKAGFETHGLPAGTVLTIDFEIEGHAFIAINGGPLFTFTPAISFLVACRTTDEVDAIWAKLSAGGAVLMELGAYPFSRRFGWTQDKYGLSWQVMFTDGREIRQKITPMFLFVGRQSGRAEEAIRLYTSIFDGAAVGSLDRFGKGEEPEKAGTIKHGTFTLEGQEFTAMDSALGHDFTFTEAISLMRNCETQEEIDYYWERLTADGGEESVCGWLKDKFGVSWQITPTVLGEMLRDPDRAKVERVMSAFLKMKKLDITALRRAFDGK